MYLFKEKITLKLARIMNKLLYRGKNNFSAMMFKHGRMVNENTSFRSTVLMYEP